MGGVEESWAAITTWLAKKVPRAVDELRPPASADDVAAVEAAVGTRLPDELRLWLRLNDGIGHRDTFGLLLPPGHNPLSCERMASAWRIWQSVDAETHPTPASAEPAMTAMTAPPGSAAYRRVPAFVPFAADGTGDHLFVDLRAGELYGCVGQWTPDGGGFTGPLWPGVGAMLAAVARSVTTGVPVFGSYDDRPAPNGREPMEPELFYEDDEWFHWE